MAHRRAIIALLTVACLPAPPAVGQVPGAPTIIGGPPRHRMHHLHLPPGQIGREQLLQRPQMNGYFQPVEVRGPNGSLVSMSAEGAFVEAQDNVVRAGLLIGHVYRFRVGNIPLREGLEVFPSVELINRLYPPPGQETRFPIPIEITAEELDMVLEGRFVTRVIYLENPDDALPIRRSEDQQAFDVDATQDPLAVADRLGRPMAILRMGSRVPLDDEGEFGFHSPPAQLLLAPPEAGVPGATIPAVPAEATPLPDAVSPASGRQSAPNAGTPALEVAPYYPRLPQRYHQPPVPARGPTSALHGVPMEGQGVR